MPATTPSPTAKFHKRSSTGPARVRALSTGNPHQRQPPCLPPIFIGKRPRRRRNISSNRRRRKKTSQPGCSDLSKHLVSPLLPGIAKLQEPRTRILSISPKHSHQANTVYSFEIYPYFSNSGGW